MKKSEITVDLGKVHLKGNVQLPENARALVIFAHGSGSSRFSPRNQFVADILNGRRIATLLTDLLTTAEDETYGNRFNIPLLADRLIKITQRVMGIDALQGLPVGYFGASTGAAAALEAAAAAGRLIYAIVSRGGRPDLAGDALPLVKAPTLLIVGSLDVDVIELNKHAHRAMTCEKKLEIVNGASHLFEEPGTLQAAAHLAAEWFHRHLVTLESREKQLQSK